LLPSKLLKKPPKPLKLPLRKGVGVRKKDKGDKGDEGDKGAFGITIQNPKFPHSSLLTPHPFQKAIPIRKAERYSRENDKISKKTLAETIGSGIMTGELTKVKGNIV
jgi:hypothetical protein